MDEKDETPSQPAVLDLHHHDDDKHSVTSQEKLLVGMEDKHRLDDVKENNNDSKQDGINEENENQDTEKLDKKGEECGEPNDELEKAKTDIEIEMKQMNADVEDEETSNTGSRKNSKKGSKKRKKKNSVENIAVAVVINNNIVENKDEEKTEGEVLSEKKDDLQNNDKKETEDQKKEQTINNGRKQDEGASNNTDNPNNVSTSMDEGASNKNNTDNPNNVSTSMDEGASNKNNTDNPNNVSTSMDEIAVMGTEEVDGFTKVTADDEIDALSTYSFKERKDFKHYFQHPYLRLFVAYFVTFCNFLIYAEDPVAHSLKECNIPLVGNDFSFVCMRYPKNAWSLLKVVLWIAAIIVGMVIGKLIFHRLVLSKIFRLKMFSDDQGSWMTMFLVSLVSLFIFSWVYNAFLWAGGSSTEDYRISGLMGLTNSIFMKMAACGTWCGDFFTAWMVTDMMLQEKLYPYWARPVRKWWNRKYNRIILFWVVTLVTSFTVVVSIATDFIQWDKLHRDFLSSNEVSRAFLASFILVMDILIVAQDWDFPHFLSAIDIKLPGVNTAHIKFDIPQCFRPEKWQIHITGKWFNYGILFLVMILDMNMWKNQIFYAPIDYGQYTDSEGKIHTIKDEYSLENHNATLMTFDYRNSTINPLTNQTYISGDSVMNSRYYDYSIFVKGIAFIPALAAFITLGILVWCFGRFRPSKQDPYAGRLLKRPKLRRKKLSFRLFGESLRKKFTLRNRIKAVPKLLAFTRGNIENKTQSDLPENWRPPTDPA